MLLLVSIQTFTSLALAFEGASEQPHFEKSSFKVKQRIFATLDTKNKKAVVRLSETDQSVFCAFDTSIIFPVDGTWGKQGWTTIDLTKIPKAMLQDALSTAYRHVATNRKK